MTCNADGSVLPGTNVFQETKYIYGVSQSAGSDIDSNDLLGATQYPDKTSGSASSGEQDRFPGPRARSVERAKMNAARAGTSLILP